MFLRKKIQGGSRESTIFSKTGYNFGDNLYDQISNFFDISFSMQASHGKVFGAHKVVLAARFPGLRSLLTQQSTLSLTRFSAT